MSILEQLREMFPGAEWTNPAHIPCVCIGETRHGELWVQKSDGGVLTISYPYVPARTASELADVMVGHSRAIADALVRGDG